MAALFLFAAFMKVSGRPAMIEEFNTIGLGQWFRYLTGTMELIGGIAIFTAVSFDLRRSSSALGRRGCLRRSNRGFFMPIGYIPS